MMWGVTGALRRIVRPLRSRKVRVALATVLAAYLAEAGLSMDEGLVLTIVSVGVAVILGIAHEDHGRLSSGGVGRKATGPRGTAGLPAIVGLLIAGACAAAGCVDGRVPLAAAEALRVVGRELGSAVEEYHADLGRADDVREEAVIAAFVERVRSRSGGAAVTRDVEALRAAMRRLREDRAVAVRRYVATRENLAVLEQIAEGLERYGVGLLSLRDETERYFSRAGSLQRGRMFEGSAGHRR